MSGTRGSFIIIFFRKMKKKLYSSKYDPMETVRHILDDVNGGAVRIEGHSALLYFCALYDDDAGAALVRGLGPGVAAHGEYDSSGYTALHCAAAFGLPLIAAALVDAGVNVETESEDGALAHLGFFQSGGRTPLHCASLEGNVELVALLLARGASADAVDFEGNTPLLLAQMRHQAACVAALEGVTRLAPSDAALRAVGASTAAASGSAAANAAVVSSAPTDAWLKAKQASDRARVKARVARCTEPRGLLRRLHVLPALLSASECAALLTAVLGTVAEEGWQNSRHAAFPTTDFRASDLGSAAWPLSRTLLEQRALPAMAALFGFRASQLSFRDLFFVKYSGAEEGVQSGLAAHRDGSLLSLNILLNAPAEFDGGGTLFLEEDVTLSRPTPGVDAASGDAEACRVADVVAIGRGDCLVHCGRLLHSGVPISRGQRYLLVGFVDVHHTHR